MISRWIILRIRNVSDKFVYKIKLQILCSITFFRKSCYLWNNLLLLQSALQTLWVRACSTNVEYSQQEGFYRVSLPAARQTSNLEDQWLERSNSRLKRQERTPAVEGGNYGREIAENFAGSSDFHVTSGFFTCRKFTTCDRRLYFPSEGRRAEDFFVWKIRRLRPGLNPQTRVTEASTHTSRPQKPLVMK